MNRLLFVVVGLLLVSVACFWVVVDAPAVSIEQKINTNEGGFIVTCGGLKPIVKSIGNPRALKVEVSE